MPLSKRFFDSLADSGDVPYAKKARPTPKRATAGIKAMKRAANMAVKRALSRTIEVKHHTYTGNNWVSNAGANIVNIYTLGYGTFPLSPFNGYVSIAQGTTDAARIGNKVKTKKCMVNLCVAPNAYDATNNPTPGPCILKIWIYRIKGASTTSELASAISGYFKDVNGSDQGLDGSYSDLNLPDNHDMMQVLHTREYKIGFAASTGTGGVAGEQYTANNDFKTFQHIKMDVTKYLYSIYDFNDNTQTPLNQATTWFTMEMIPYDNVVASVGARPGTMQMSIDYSFTDA